MAAADSLRDKVPPHNDEAEVATIGALLLDPESLATVLKYLRPEDFYKTAHQRIYQAILALFDRSEAIDLITLNEELKTMGLLKSCGGPAYISQLTSAVPTSANIKYYAQIVQALSMRRNLARIASQINASSFDDSTDVRYIIEEAERQIFELTDKQHTGSYQVAREIVSRTIEVIEKLFHNSGDYIGVPSGFSSLDSYTAGFQNAEFIVIGARPSVGKTALALTMAANMSVKNHIPVGFFTLEMSSMALMQRLLSSEARLKSHALRSGILKPSDFHKLTEAAGKIYEAPLYIEDSPNLKLLDLRAQARRMRSQHKVSIIFIDYLTLIGSEHQDMPRHEQIAEISRSLKALARELNIPVVALSQVSRESEGKRPSLANIRESGSIEQDADVVIFLHRERQPNADGDDIPHNIRTEVIIAKQRNGPVGTIELAFIPEYTKFEDMSKDTGIH